MACSESRDVADGMRASRRRRVHDEGIGRALVRARISEPRGRRSRRTHIYGPFEAGFSAQRTTSSRTGGARRRAGVRHRGWIGSRTAGQVASACGSSFRESLAGNTSASSVRAVDTPGYHFHGGFGCFEWFGDALDRVERAGRWSVRVEDYAGEVPVSRRVRWALRDDAGFALDVGVSLYIQRDAPFTLGCHGPTRAVWSPSRSAGSIPRARVDVPFTINGTTVTYMRDCPCFDAQGKNFGTPTELPAISRRRSVTSSMSPLGAADSSITVTTGAYRRSLKLATDAFFRNAFFRNVAHAFESDRRAQPDSRHRRCDVGVDEPLARDHRLGVRRRCAL